MVNRIKLKKILENTLQSSKVYFNPPSNIKLSYPCIVYDLDEVEDTYANNKKYIQQQYYRIILCVVDKDDAAIERFHNVPGFKFQNTYNDNNLHYYVWKAYI